MPSFLPLGGRAHWAKRALIASIGLSLVALVADFQQWTLTKRVATGEATLDELRTNDSVQAFIALAQLAALIAAGILFLCWFHRAYANLKALGTEGLPHGPGWAVGYWFVPIINLVRPATVACDLWNASDPASDPGAWRQRKQPRLIIGWWLTFLLSGLVGRIGTSLWNGASDPDRLRQAAVVLLVADVLTIAAGVLAVVFVRETTTRQEMRASTLQRPPTAATA
jgi:hypothetical protein